MKISILTISDTRNLENDLSGKKIEELAQEHEILTRKIVKDERTDIQQAYEKLDTEIIITNGGTGLAKRDVTFEALQPFVSREIPGFGEIFRKLSYEEIGSHAIASRAFAFFNHKDQLTFVLPGSTKACELAMKKLILAELEHLIHERRK